MGESEFLKEMGQRICARRKALKLTQEQLAEKLGVSTQMISNLELGKKAIRPENLVKLCSELELSADFVLTGNSGSAPLDGICKKLASLSDNELWIINDMLDYMIDKK